MKKYVALGCSLTAQDGFVNYINQNYNLEIENLAVSAGSNALQMHKLNNLLIRNQIGKDTTLLWQITSPARDFEILPKIEKKFQNGIPYEGTFDWIPEKINLYDSNQIVLLCNNEYFKHQPIKALFNMQSLACDLYKWSKIVKRIILYVGWNSMMSPTLLRQFMDFLKNTSNIEILDSKSSIVDWCQEKKLDFEDTGHPTKDSYIQWGNEVLIPVIFKN